MAWMISDVFTVLSMTRRENTNRLARVYRRHGLPS
jgi:hypothetical protein